MELRHLRYFLATGEALSFTKAAEKLRVAQPALSRQIQDLEDEIGVVLLHRSTRSVKLTAEGNLFLKEVRTLLANADEAVKKVQALARAEEGELHVGYSPSVTVDFIPQAMAAFQKAAPRVVLTLHDLASDEITQSLQNGTLQLGITVLQTGESMRGLEFEALLEYPFCIAMSRKHVLAKLKSVPLEKAAQEPLVVYDRSGYSQYHRTLKKVFAQAKTKPRIAVECDSASSLFNQVETGIGIAVVIPTFRAVAGSRLAIRPLSGVLHSQVVGILRATKGDVTPAGESFCKLLRKITRANKKSVKYGLGIV